MCLSMDQRLPDHLILFLLMVVSIHHLDQPQQKPSLLFNHLV